MNTKKADRIAIAQAKTLYKTLDLLQELGSELSDSDLRQLMSELDKWLFHAK
jgi:hypothetical protein